MLLSKLLTRTHFDSYADFKKNYELHVPEHFNFARDVVDAWAEADPEKRALVWLNDRGERLMIYRNGRWDLPKGHWERGETIEACALREVREETGVAASIRRHLCDTLHCYQLRGEWEMKRTRWFEMAAAADATLRPQTEEGIDRVCWCTPAEVELHLQQTFPTIRRVFAKL